MITLFTSGRYFGLPDPSPFVVKVMMLLKMSGIPYEEKLMRFREAPKSKIPYISDDGVLLGDSHFIGKHLERAHGTDFSGGYPASELAKGWAVARMMEEHFYFLNVHERWMHDGNFNKGPKQFFGLAPAPIRPIVRTLIRSKVRKMLVAQGIGRHSDAERLELATGDIYAVETLLGSGKYILGDRMSGADASVFPFLLSGACPFFDTLIGDHIRSRLAIVSYLERVGNEFFPATVP
jgi:glutathione S-transferase